MARGAMPRYALLLEVARQCTNSPHAIWSSKASCRKHCKSTAPRSRKSLGGPDCITKPAIFLWRMREVDTAIAELQAELTRTPHHGLANLRLGQVFLTRNQAAEAVVYLEHAVDAMPESAEARRELGRHTAASAARPTRGHSGRRLPARVRMTTRCIIC